MAHSGSRTHAPLGRTQGRTLFCFALHALATFGTSPVRCSSPGCLARPLMAAARPLMAKKTGPLQLSGFRRGKVSQHNKVSQHDRRTRDPVSLTPSQRATRVGRQGLGRAGLCRASARATAPDLVPGRGFGPTRHTTVSGAADSASVLERDPRKPRHEAGCRRSRLKVPVDRSRHRVELLLEPSKRAGTGAGRHWAGL